MTEKQRAHLISMKEFLPETPALLAIAITLIFAGLMSVLAWHSIPGENKDVFMVGFGAIVVLLKDTYARYLNNSKSGQDRTDQLIDLAKNSEPNK